MVLVLDAHTAYLKVLEEMKKYIAGKVDVIELMFIAIVADGHALLEGVPGVAKTTISKALASTIQADFKRIQGTPDLMPRDIMGYTYLDSTNAPTFKKGPVFTNILLIDELNRVPQKTMTALLEALEERQITTVGVDMPLPKPFTAFATQNPLKIEGTEPLPKVLADRFLMKIDVDYPTMDEEREMIGIKETTEMSAVNRVLDTQDILEFQQKAKDIRLQQDVVEYIISIVNATRTDIHVLMGASPRADIAMMQCSKAKALIEGRSSVTKEDIKFLAKPILSHRMVVRATGGVGVRGVIDGILASTG
jgi:MoxR-like ATPase